MADLVERLRGPVREAASRLIAGSFRRDGERLAEKRSRFSIPARPDEDDDLVLIAALEEAAAALEAEASEGKRLREATMSEARNAVLSAIYHDERDADVAYAAIRAFIPEAPVREGE